MNKYSKRALKTTATVGMSLAMVLSAAMPVMAAAPDPTCATTNDATKAACKGMIYDLTEAINKIGLEELTVNSTATINGAKDTPIIATILINKAGLEATANGSDYSNLKKWLAVINEIAADGDKGMFSPAYFTGDVDTDDKEKTGGLVNAYNTELVKTGTTADATNWSAENLAANTTASTAAVKAYEKMTAWIADGYYDRLDETLATRFDSIYETLEERTADYVVADADITREFVAAWTIVLDADMSGTAGEEITFDKNEAKNDALFAATGLEVNETINIGNKIALKDRIAAIKDAPNYYRVKEDDGVLDIIEQYNELLGNITDLKDLLKDASYKAFTSTKVKTNDDDATLKAFFKTIATLDKTGKAGAEQLGSQLTAEQLEVLVALKEDVLDFAYNFETKKVGNYYVDKSSFVSGFSGTTTVTTDFGRTADIMFGLVDNKEGLFGIDVVIEQAQKAVDAYAAVTTDIEKLTPANIKAADKAKLVAAEDALYELESDGDFRANLTKAQIRELRRITTKIDNLREAFDNLGTTTATGWYDMGNGNWGYNYEDGTPATKWVAAGKDWYYVKGGNMLRNAWIAENATGARWYYVNDKGVMVTNTVVDGYTIDANGIWTK